MFGFAWWWTAIVIFTAAIWVGGRMWFSLFAPARSRFSVAIGWVTTYAAIVTAVGWPFAAWFWLLAILPGEGR